MPINVNTTPEQIGVTVGETQIDVAVGGGVGPTGNTGVVNVSAPITNTGTTTAADIGLSVGTGLEVFAGALAVSFGSSAFQVCRGDDARLSNSREWSASTVTQAEAEAGTSTTRRAFTPLRVFQAIAAWWAASSAKTKLDGIATGATANATDAQLRDRSTHTGSQLAATISDFASAVVAAAPPTTNASLLTSGTLPDARLSSNIARTSDVSSAVAAVVNAAPATLDTLKELADALGSDANFSTTVTNALAAKAPLASPTFTGTVSGITATMVGLGNVDNTSDANKPISTATQTALDGKAASSHTHTASAITDFTAAVVAAAPAYSLPTASGSILGGVKIGYGLSIDGSGVLTATYSYTLPAATTTTLGGVIVGTGLAVSSGTVSVSYGTASGTACQGNDSRLSDARTPTSHTHGNITNAGAIGSTANLPVITTTSGVLTTGAFGTSSGQFAAGDHTHAQLHDRSHAITSTSDHTAGNWKVFYSNGSGQVVELALGNSGQYLTANGTAAAPTFTTPSSGGSTNVWIPASAFIPRTTNGPGVDSRETSTNKQNFDEVLFDAAAIEYADALVILPSNYNNSTVTARFYWTAASGSGDVVFAIAGRAFANDDALDTAYGTAKSATDTLLSANDMHVSAATSAMTLGGTPAANTPAQFTVYRDATNAGDTLAVDARLLGVEIIYTAA